MSRLVFEETRIRAVQQVRAYLQVNTAPRVAMAFMVLVTGLSGFLFSVLLLRFGISVMYLRYAVSVALAYGVFLFQIWLWLAFHRSRLNGGSSTAGASRDTSPGQYLNHLDVSFELFCPPSSSPVTPLEHTDAGPSSGSLAEADEAVVILAAIALAAVVLAVSAYVVAIAPTLLAEVFLDGVLSAALYRRVRTFEQRPWTWAVFRKTLLPVLLVIVFFAIAGAVMHAYAPDADSIGDVWSLYRQKHH